MIPAAYLQSPEWVAEHTLEMREANLSSSAKTEPGWKQRLKTLVQLAFSFFAGSSKTCIKKSDAQTIWLGDSTNQLFKIDDTKETYPNDYLRQI